MDRQEVDIEAKKETEQSRWGNQSEKTQRIWGKYDQEIIPNVIKQTLVLKPDTSLEQLYLILAKMRGECEYNKAPYKKKHLEFGQPTLGGTSEQGIFGSSWGEIETSFITNRLTSKEFHYQGLSLITANDWLTHPSGAVLVMLNNTFQQLLTTNNLSEYLQLSSRLAFNLFNYPPIVRGGCAVTSWIINNIAKIKFDIPRITPSLIDWAAFFETPEQYYGFYQIGSTVEYLKSIPTFYKMHKEFLDKIPIELRNDPNKPDNLRKRKYIWESLKEHMAQAVRQNVFNNNQTQQIDTLLNMQIPFRESSVEVRNLVDLIKPLNESNITRDRLLRTLDQSNISEEKFKILLNFHENIISLHIQGYGDPEQEKIQNSVWPDLEILRTVRNPVLDTCKNALNPENTLVNEPSLDNQSPVFLKTKFESNGLSIDEEMKQTPNLQGVSMFATPRDTINGETENPEITPPSENIRKP